MSDLRMTLTADGSSLTFVGGQPIMDDGLENLVLISLFTGRGWCGNKVLKVPIGSDFEQSCNQPITLRSLNEIRNAAERALVSPLLGKVTVSVSNPANNRLMVTVLVERTGVELSLLREGGNWWFQDNDPAHRRGLKGAKGDWSKSATEYDSLTFQGDDVTFQGIDCIMSKG